MASVYRKTRKGVAEIETRANGLAPRLRAALILVDGRRSETDLQKLIVADAAGSLATLVDQGYIEALASRPAVAAPTSASSAVTRAPMAVGAAASAGSTAAGAAAGAVPLTAKPRTDAAAKAPSLPEVKTLAVRRLLDLLGPMAEGMAIRIEKLGTWNELLPVLNVACAMVRDMRGTAAAVEFAERFVVPYESRA